jgi:peroxidase
MYPISFGFISILAFFSSSFLTLATPWPYTRAFTNGTVPPDEHDDHIPNQFLTWLKSAHDASGQLANAFVNNSIPQHVRSFVELESYFLHYHATHPREMPKVAWDTLPPPDQLSSQELASALFSNLPFQLEPSCVDNKSKFWYRQPNGGCNWLKRGEHQLGTTFSGHPRDFNQTAYADGVSTPRVGPNPREVSNAFFKRKARLYYEHTPLLLGLIEFLMHDVSYSADSETEWIDVPIPAGDPAYDPHSFGNASFRVSRTKAADGTGTGIRNPRQPINEATAWLDASALYGSTEVVADALRSHVDGKLKAQRGKDGFEYLPLNVEGLPMRTRPGVDPRSLFLGGDVRTNEDWIMLS